MNIIFDENSQVQIVGQAIQDKMKQAAEYCLGEEDVESERAEISVTFVTEEEIKELNDQYRNIDKVTDVLSFPQFDDFEDIPEVGEICLGDVVICIKRAEEQAKEFGHSLDREIIYLFVHSILHLLGYDHMEKDDKIIMREQEEKIMSHIGLERE